MSRMINLKTNLYIGAKICRQETHSSVLFANTVLRAGLTRVFFLRGFCAIRSYVGTFALHNSLGIVRFDRVFVFGTTARRDIVESLPYVFEHFVININYLSFFFPLWKMSSQIFYITAITIFYT